MLKVVVTFPEGPSEVFYETEDQLEKIWRVWQRVLHTPQDTPPERTSQTSTLNGQRTPAPPPAASDPGPEAPSNERHMKLSFTADGKFASPSGISQAQRIERCLHAIGRPATIKEIIERMDDLAEMLSNTKRSAQAVVGQVLYRGHKFVHCGDGVWALREWIQEQPPQREDSQAPEKLDVGDVNESSASAPAPPLRLSDAEETTVGMSAAFDIYERYFGGEAKQA